MASVPHLTSSSSLMVNIQAGAELKLIEYVAECIASADQEAAEEFSKECADLVGQADAPGLIRRILAQSDVLLQQRENEGDTEGCFHMLCSLLFKVENEADLPILTSEICSKLLDTEKASEKAPMKLKVITNLYNLLKTGDPSQQVVLVAIIRFAAASNQISLLMPYFNDIDSWLSGLQVDKIKQREIYLLIADSLSALGKSHESQKFLMKLLCSYDGEDASVLSEARELAARGAAQAVRFPLLSFTQGQGQSLLRLDVVAQLEKEQQYKALHKLLCIFSSEKLDEFEEFIKKNDILEKYDLNKEECTANMRLLSLASLATEHEEIPYHVIADTLKIEPEHVEDWVVRAINAGLLEAKMDQLNQVVMISRCTQRQFGKEQWAELGSKLNV